VPAENTLPALHGPEMHPHVHLPIGVRRQVLWQLLVMQAAM
jgi:hypothetical protein